MIFFQELCTGDMFPDIEIGGFSVSEKLRFQKAKFQIRRNLGWLIHAIQAVTNATSVSTSQPCSQIFRSVTIIGINLRSELKPSPTSFKIAGYVKLLQKDKRIPIGSTKSMASLLQFSVVEV